MCQNRFAPSNPLPHLRDPLRRHFAKWAQVAANRGRCRVADSQGADRFRRPCREGMGKREAIRAGNERDR